MALASEAILAGFAGAPSPDAVFAGGLPAATVLKDDREWWGWRPGAVALAAAAWAGARFLWPRVRRWVRAAEPPPDPAGRSGPVIGRHLPRP
jgi:hypothetical protein